MTEEQAKKRLLRLTGVRLLGLAILLAGLWLVGEAHGQTTPLIMGLLIMATGFSIAIFGSLYLLRKWRA